MASDILHKISVPICNYFNSFNFLHVFIKMSLGERIVALKASHRTVWTCDISGSGKLCWVSSLQLGEVGTWAWFPWISFSLYLFCVFWGNNKAHTPEEENQWYQKMGLPESIFRFSYNRKSAPICSTSNLNFRVPSQAHTNSHFN